MLIPQTAASYCEQADPSAFSIFAYDVRGPLDSASSAHLPAPAGREAESRPKRHWPSTRHLARTFVETVVYKHCASVDGIANSMSAILRTSSSPSRDRWASDVNRGPSSAKLFALRTSFECAFGPLPQHFDDALAKIAAVVDPHSYALLWACDLPSDQLRPQ